MDLHVFIGPPDLEARVELIKQFMQGRPQKGMDFLEVAEKGEFYTSAELEHIVNEAAMRALQNHRPIAQEDLVLASNENPPRLNKDKVEGMRKPIGFV
jgi:cell division protease FtsH